MEFGLELDEFCDLIGPEDMERMSAGIRTEADSKSAATEGDGSKKSRGDSGAAGRGRRRDGDEPGRLLLDDSGGVSAGARSVAGGRGVKDAERLGDGEDAVGVHPAALEQEAAEAVGRAEVPLGRGGAD